MILFFYTALKPRHSPNHCQGCLMILFFYTALKPSICIKGVCASLMILFFYTALKRRLKHKGSKSVWWSFSFTLLSNAYDGGCHNFKFDDPFLLHCSQTNCHWQECEGGLMILFFYTALKPAVPIFLNFFCLMILFFYTALKLNDRGRFFIWVWWSFSFTLLSNNERIQKAVDEFDDPFLLHCSQTHPDRRWIRTWFDDPFLLHCSQTTKWTYQRRRQFDDPFLLHCSQTQWGCVSNLICLMILFFYTALKPKERVQNDSFGLMILFFYTALKLVASQNWYGAVWWSFSFTLLSNSTIAGMSWGMFDDPFLLHCSQTPVLTQATPVEFDDPFLLHCSQTCIKSVVNGCVFDDPFLLHCSQT